MSEPGRCGVCRHDWRSRNPECAVQQGAVLGWITNGQGFVLDPRVERFAVYLDTRRATVWCPACGAAREFRGTSVIGA